MFITGKGSCRETPFLYFLLFSNKQRTKTLQGTIFILQYIYFCKIFHIFAKIMLFLIDFY
jgi:hypothetical protein